MEGRRERWGEREGRSGSGDLPLHLPLSLSISITINPPVYLYQFYQPTYTHYKLIHLPTCLSIYSPVSLSIFLSAYLVIYLSVPTNPLIPTHLPTSLTTHLLPLPYLLWRISLSYGENVGNVMNGEVCLRAPCEV